ncbi:THAP domain-containing protein 5-like [Formica exsecta]|uniref:THAP domain-containing protein 5-like n=1 Tax=Formica exsecta TaxID=72781 RepID=UPI0011425649|nr:THAP domain-containing protein 5-like [Formica exsecta]
MGGCSAEFCNNSSSKGYIMKIFLRDPQRCASWAKNVGRQNWTPTKNSYLCEIHFAPDTWEQRSDGKRKLKPNAVPTIFGFFLKKEMPIAENKNNEVLLKNNIDENDNVLDNDVSNNELINNENQDVKCEIITNTSELDNDVSNNELINNENQDVECEVSIKIVTL